MGRIRPFTIGDIPAVVHLYEMIYGHEVATSTPAFPDYLERIFFHNPWADPELPSLVYEDEGGGLVGFVGVIPRRMAYRGCPIRVAVSTSFMVNPDRRHTLAGVLLQKAFFSGAQDLSITDGANDVSRVIWEKLGGIAVPLYGLWWTRLLRPAQFALDIVKRKREYLSPLTIALKPLSLAVDGMIGCLKPNDFDRQLGHTSQCDLDAKTLLKCIEKFSSKEVLHPSYDLRALTWLLDAASEKQQYGALRKSLVRDAQGDIVGWYLYYQKPSAGSHVLQLMAQRESIHQVLSHLFLDAWRAGSCSVTGRIEPRFIPQLSENYCYFHAGTWMLIHSANHELLQTICRGDAFLTWLEGERWTRFLEFVE